MVKRLLLSLLILVPVAVIAQIDWTKQIKNVPSYVANALADPGSNGFVKRTAANTSTVAGSTDVWPGTLPYTSVTGGTSGVWPGTVRECPVGLDSALRHSEHNLPQPPQ